jgi:S-methylmethionine-dependent homocysteine/selenocysteine methylase
MSKNEAIIKVLKVLKSAMMVMCKPNRDEALTLAEEHGTTVKDLIEEWQEMSYRV